MAVATINGATMYYETSGAGVPIVFIHPPVITSENFYYQKRDLSQDFQVICFDIRGHGNSGYSEEPLTYPLIARDMKGLLDTLGISQAYLCGYSTGGSIALEFMLTYPERALGGILLSGMSEASDLRLKQLITLGKSLAQAGALRLLAYTIAHSNSDSASLFRRMYAAALKGNAENIAQYYDYSRIYRCTDQLHQIEKPLLAIYGDQDKSFESYSRMIHQKVNGSELALVHGVKHQLPAKAASEVNELIREFIFARQEQTKDWHPLPFVGEGTASLEELH
ncbi:alpha/beta fold hydrolase [Brevibacillus sp. B_LB10_24]|uniref:alpha/beta fold hydrolase n=1 Tax=Brevibacillus sp. B_LB10_24 TaxID=3380645 RepID=UPI0038B6C198